MRRGEGICKILGISYDVNKGFWWRDGIYAKGKMFGLGLFYTVQLNFIIFVMELLFLGVRGTMPSL